MPSSIDIRIVAVFASVALHALVFTLAGNDPFGFTRKPEALKPEARIVVLEVAPPPAAQAHKRPQPAQKAVAPAPAPAPAPAIPAPPNLAATTPVTDRQPAFMAAPAAPTAEEWALAARYTLRNSKSYRYTWGQQVRSMMGTAVEGPEQGAVRFQVEIAPDGTLARLETLWTTSTAVEQRARRAIENMPPLPPTPTGKPLIFERTITFSAFASDGPPVYKDDCLPDPPAFRNPFAWNGKSPQVWTEPTSVEKPDPQALEECLKQLPQDSIEAESARDQRLRDQWDSSKLGR